MMQKKVIVTGANGFTGKYLMQELVQYGIHVIGTWHQNAPDDMTQFEWYQIDFLKSDECEKLINSVKPDALIHLAAQNSVIIAREKPQQTINNNVLGAVNLLEAVRKNSIETKCILAGSAAIYDAAVCDFAITEEMPVKCKNMYALTKHFQEQIAERYYVDYDMNIICTRPFNYTGYLQGENCFIPNLCRQVSEIAKGKREPVLRLGNLSVSRDFLDVRDIVSAYRLLLNDNIPHGIYNIASGNSVKLIDIVDYLCKKAEIEIEISINQELLRKDDIAYICGDSEKIKTATGWDAKYSIFDTIDWIYERMQEENEW